MGLWQSAPTEDSLGLSVYGVKFLQAYTICCGYCCKDKPDHTEGKANTFGCRQCPWMYYCSQKCRWDDSEMHVESHRAHACGELVIKIAPPSSKSKPQWQRPAVQSQVRFVNAGTGAIRVTFPDNSVKVLVQKSKAKILTATELERVDS
jgi:hypothetical protein